MVSVFWGVPAFSLKSCLPSELSSHFRQSFCIEDECNIFRLEPVDLHDTKMIEAGQNVAVCIGNNTFNCGDVERICKDKDDLAINCEKLAEVVMALYPLSERSSSNSLNGAAPAHKQQTGIFIPRLNLTSVNAKKKDNIEAVDRRAHSGRGQINSVRSAKEDSANNTNDAVQKVPPSHMLKRSGKTVRRSMSAVLVENRRSNNDSFSVKSSDAGRTSIIATPRRPLKKKSTKHISNRTSKKIEDRCSDVEVQPQRIKVAAKSNTCISSKPVIRYKSESPTKLNKQKKTVANDDRRINQNKQKSGSLMDEASATNWTACDGGDGTASKGGPLLACAKGGPMLACAKGGPLIATDYGDRRIIQNKQKSGSLMDEASATNWTACDGGDGTASKGGPLLACAKGGPMLACAKGGPLLATDPKKIERPEPMKIIKNRGHYTEIPPKILEYSGLNRKKNSCESEFIKNDTINSFDTKSAECDRTEAWPEKMNPKNDEKIGNNINNIPHYDDRFGNNYANIQSGSDGQRVAVSSSIPLNYLRINPQMFQSSHELSPAHQVPEPSSIVRSVSHDILDISQHTRHYFYPPFNRQVRSPYSGMAPNIRLNQQTPHMNHTMYSNSRRTYDIRGMQADTVSDVRLLNSKRTVSYCQGDPPSINHKMDQNTQSPQPVLRQLPNHIRPSCEFRRF
eukprot:GHVL01036330.1.p1 GENE.GHVL01036330.1~~GHVL01036330.1.p1  ORF type:complete len:681 (-),score=133.17 GHVL01036330.1:1477-3519(-)